MRSGTINRLQKLDSEEQFRQIIEQSYAEPVFIFKNSSRCGVSRFALQDFQEKLAAEENPKGIYYLLEIVEHSALSNIIASTFNVRHESPQLLIIRNGECVYLENHWNISFEEAFYRISSFS